MLRRLSLIMLLWPLATLAEAVECEHAVTTLALVECAEQTLHETELELQQTMLMVLTQYQYDSAIITAIQHGNMHWQRYKTSHCHAVYTAWEGGSIRNIMYLQCQIKLTRDYVDAMKIQFILDGK